MAEKENEADEKMYELTERDLQQICWHAGRLALGDGASVDGIDILDVLSNRLGKVETKGLMERTVISVLDETLYEDEDLAHTQREMLLARVKEQRAK